MSTVRHPNRRRTAFTAITRALVAWHPQRTQGQVLALRQRWPRWPRITPDRDPPPVGGIAHAV